MRTAKYGLKKTALSLIDGNNCRKCKLRKDESPLFTAAPPPRKGAAEKILVVLSDFARGPRGVYSDAEARLVNEAVRSINVDRVVHIPIVKCAHNKAPTKLMIECCEPTTRKELETIKPNVILCLGKGPATAFNMTGRLDAIRTGVFDVVGLDGCKPKLVVSYPLESVLKDISLRTEFMASFKKAERFCSNVEFKAPEHYAMFESPAELNTWVDKLIANKDKFIVAADIETNGRYQYEPKARMRCISFSWATGYGVCVPFEDDEKGYLPILIKLFESDVRFIFHNSVFDLSFMRVVYGIIVHNLIADTMLMAYLLDPTRGKYGYGLKPLSQEHTDLGAYETEVKDGEDDVDENGVVVKTKWEKVDMLTLGTYNICDCDATLQIYKKFFRELHRMHMTDASDLLAQAVHVICDLEINGVLIDQEFVKDTIPKLEGLLEQYDKELTELAGGKYDWNSPKELGKLLYEVLGFPNPYGPNFGAYPTDDEALDRINTPFTKAMRKYRKAFKLCNTYFKGYFSKVQEDGRLRANYWLNSTETGRLSSDEPNLQNLPRKMGKDDVGYEDLAAFKVKNAIVAPEGWTVVQAD